jgi:hypothetical protein
MNVNKLVEDSAEQVSVDCFPDTFDSQELTNS